MSDSALRSGMLTRMPSRAMRVFIVLALVPALTGCLTSESLIRVRADGGGTIETVLLVDQDAFEGMAGLLGEGAKGGVTEKHVMSFEPSDLRAQAAKHGPGVRFVSSDPMTRGALQGARMIYEFDDVNALRLESDPMGGAMGSPRGGTGGDAALRLTRQPNGHARLAIDFDQASAPKAKTRAGKSTFDMKDMPPGMEAILGDMLSGFRIAIDVEVDGAIVQTSSPFVTASRVTLLEMDLGALLNDKKGLARLMAMSPGTSAAGMAAALKDVKGIKVNESPVTIEFTAR